MDDQIHGHIRLSLELCTAYITSEDDILSKLSNFIQNVRIRKDFCQSSIERRSEIIDQLSKSYNGNSSMSSIDVKNMF